MALLGIYVGNDPNHLRSFESWLGRPVDGLLGVVGGASWWDFISSAQWMVNTLWSEVGRNVFWSVPLIVADNTASLAAAAAGDYDAYYISVAQSLLTPRTQDDGPVYVRTGWEANAEWFPWAAAGKEDDFIGAFRALVDAFRSVSDRFRFEWNVNQAWDGLDPTTIYPGDEYVDVIGMDFYYDIRFDSCDPLTAWQGKVNSKYGLAWLENFAAAHGKPTAYSEWGVETNNAGPYIDQAKVWFASHNVAYQTYWDSDAAYSGQLSDNGMPQAGAAYRASFGAKNSLVVADVVESVEAQAGTQSYGTAAAEFWVGTSGNDKYTSNGGSDTMLGKAGDDVYIISSDADQVVELLEGGIDTVETWLPRYMLPNNVENFVATGTSWTTVTGNALANRITGNDRSNTIDGGAGNDVLTGGGGSDSFVIRPGDGNDTVTDFATKAAAGKASDLLKLVGFGPDANLSHVGESWMVTGADGETKTVLLHGVTELAAADYLWA